MTRVCKEITTRQLSQLIGQGIDLDPDGCHVLTPIPANNSTASVTCFLLAKLISSSTPLELILNIPRNLFDNLIHVEVEQLLGGSP